MSWLASSNKKSGCCLSRSKYSSRVVGGQGRSPTLPHTLSCVRTRARTTIMCRPSRQDGCTFGGVHGDSTLSAIKTAFASLCLSAEAPPCLGRLPRVGGIFSCKTTLPSIYVNTLSGRRSEVRLRAGGDDLPLFWLGSLLSFQRPGTTTPLRGMRAH